jgi:phosphoribosylformylglycinamidine synthase subunit PurQ / glutaminase
MKPRICILKTDGTNCDQETAHACVRAGGHGEIVLLNQLRAQKNLLSQFQVLVIPGGFSYGDDIASGKILALELMIFLYDQLNEFVEQGKLIIGICNGFQVLVRAQLLPQRNNHKQIATLLTNDSGKFECRWVSLNIEPTDCIFTQGLAGTTIMLPIAHAEGKFFAQEEDLNHLEAENLVVLRYGKNTSTIPDDHPYNPNGSVHDIAGICNPTGRVFGLMPHPERFIYSYQHPLRTREKNDPIGLTIFKNAIEYAQRL